LSAREPFATRTYEPSVRMFRVDFADATISNLSDRKSKAVVDSLNAAVARERQAAADAAANELMEAADAIDAEETTPDEIRAWLRARADFIRKTAAKGGAS
jgi:hypothetical protein